MHELSVYVYTHAVNPYTLISAVTCAIFINVQEKVGLALPPPASLSHVKNSISKEERIRTLPHVESLHPNRNHFSFRCLTFHMRKAVIGEGGESASFLAG